MLIQPHGGKLVDRVMGSEERQKAQQELPKWPQVVLAADMVSEVQNIARGVFSPLEGFLGQAQLESIVRQGRLPDGLPWTIPILLAVDGEQADHLEEGQPLALMGPGGDPLAAMRLEEKYRFDRKEIARGVFGRTGVK